jgi:hypothetical protein
VADPRAASPWRRVAPFTALAVFAAALVVAATLMMFSRFMPYDDEGYVLLSLRNFATHGRLYTEVYSQYGPLPYTFYHLLHLIGVPVTHVTGRIITIGAWSGAALFSSMIAWRGTRSYALVAAVLAAAGVCLWVMVNEPSHPGGLIVLMTAVLAALGAQWLASDRRVAWSLLAGVGTAALLLTKINVGVFATISTGAFLLLHHRSPFAQRWSPLVVMAGFAVLPWALMRALLHSPWVQTYAIIYSLSAVMVAGAAAVARTPCLSSREIRIVLAAAAGVMTAIFGLVLARGTTFSDLLQGVLLGPLRHPIAFSLAFKWWSGAVGLAIGSGLLFCLACWWRNQGKSGQTDLLVAILRVLAALGLCAFILRFPSASPANPVFSYAPACLWFFAWPMAAPTAGAAAGRSWITLLAVGQFLHPYPVPGSQLAWGTFLVIPLAAIGGWEAMGYLYQRWAKRSGRLDRFAAVPRLAALAFAGYVGLQLANVGRQYFDGRTLALPGAESICLPDESTARYQVLAFNALAHSDVLFSLPGMFSFNLWTGLPTPTLANVTHWFSLLDRSQQQAIIDQLEQHPRAAVIVDTGHLQFLRDRNLAPAGLLYDYIERVFTPAFSIDGFEFRVRQGRRLAAYFTGEVSTRPAASSVSALPDRENTRLVLPLLLPADQTIASIEIISRGNQAPAMTLREDAVRIEVTPITAQGDPRGPVAPRHLPFALTGPSSVALHFDGKKWPFSVTDTVIVLRNPAGAELGLARLCP